MDPNVDKLPGLSLPQPHAEVGSVGSEQPQSTSEIAPQTVAAAPAAAAPPVSWLPPTVPLQATPPAAPDPTPTAAAPAIADDGDLIEKEWVLKAKQIVERTKLDPHMQSKEINKFKADYMKKRYNKDIKAVNE